MENSRRHGRNGKEARGWPTVFQCWSEPRSASRTIKKLYWKHFGYIIILSIIKKSYCRKGHRACLGDYCIKYTCLNYNKLCISLSPRGGFVSNRLQILRVSLRAQKRIWNSTTWRTNNPLNSRKFNRLCPSPKSVVYQLLLSSLKSSEKRRKWLESLRDLAKKISKIYMQPPLLRE